MSSSNEKSPSRRQGRERALVARGTTLFRSIFYGSILKRRINGRSRVSRLPGNLRHVLSGEDLQPIDLPSLAGYVPTPPAHRRVCSCITYSLSSIDTLVKCSMALCSLLLGSQDQRGQRE